MAGKPPVADPQERPNVMLDALFYALLLAQQRRHVVVQLHRVNVHRALKHQVACRTLRAAAGNSKRQTLCFICKSL